MNEDYTIVVPFDEKELQEMLYEDRSFQWVFPAEEDGDVQITIKLFKEGGDKYPWNTRGAVRKPYAPATKQAVEQTTDD